MERKPALKWIRCKSERAGTVGEVRFYAKFVIITAVDKGVNLRQAKEESSLMGCSALSTGKYLPLFQHLQSKALQLYDSEGAWNKAFRRTVAIYQPIRRYFPEEFNIQQRRCEDLQFLTKKKILQYFSFNSRNSVCWVSRKQFPAIVLWSPLTFRNLASHI